MDERIDRGALLDLAVERLAVLTGGRASTGRRHDDADDVEGTVATDDAVGFDPRPLLRACAAAGAPVVVIGQVAGILHGSTELTGDLDLLWDGAPAHAPALVAALRSVGATLVDDDDRPVATDEAAFTLPKVVFTTDRASGDLCTPRLPWGALDVGAVVERAEAVRLTDGTVVRVVTRADLVAMRRAVGRPKDLRRAAELEDLGSPGPLG